MGAAFSMPGRMSRIVIVCDREQQLKIILHGCRHWIFQHACECLLYGLLKKKRVERVVRTREMD